MARPAAPAPGWWGERFEQYTVAEKLLYQPLSKSQIKGAERGEALISFARGSITAVVGSGYANTVTLKLKPLTDREWKKAVTAIAADADISRRLLSGAPGAELERVLATAGIELFPTGRAPTIRCDCWDRYDCRHARVLTLRAGRMMDANPLLWLEALGRSREALLAAVRAETTDRAAAAQSESAGTAPPLVAERFLSTAADPDAIPVRAGATVAPDALLKLLGPLPLPTEAAADRTVARYLASISRQAAELAAGDRAPQYGDEVPEVGKRIPLKHRLSPEIEAAVERAETALNIAELHAACPTAAAMPWPDVETAMADALTLLGPEYMTLTGGYVGLTATVLTGTAFRHVISLSEWRRGRLCKGSDWEMALAAAGFAPPFRIQIGGAVCRVLDPEHPRSRDDLFKQLQPRVGDELQLTLTDLTEPVLVGTLVPREARSQAGLLEADRVAVGLLAAVLKESRAWALTERESFELLLAKGCYRNGVSPDPAWLLPAAAGAGSLNWGHDRTLSSYSWNQAEPSFGRAAFFGVWQNRHTVTHQFATALLNAGKSRREAEAALACVEAWCRVWPGDQRDVRRPPELAAFAWFLWNVAPVTVKAAGDSVPEVMSAWFRFLGEGVPALERAFREHLAVCDMTQAYALRRQNLPAGKGRDALLVWEMEGYRWLGAELFFTP